MKPKNTNGSAGRQKERRKSAVESAVFYTAVLLLSAAAVLWVRIGLNPSGFFARLLLIIVVLEIGSILPIWISLKARLKEIEGGELDEASKY